MHKLGFIGLGIMGLPMALNLLKAGFSLTVYNRTRKKCDSLVALGAVAAESPQETAAESDVVITVLSDTGAVASVLFGEDGVWHGLRANSTLIDMSTISPRATIEFASRLQERACEMLDAPVSGGETGAKSAALGIMAGGKREVFERCMPVFQALAKTVTYAGPVGNGQKTKLVNQVVGSINLLATVEGIRLARAAGLNPETALRAMSSGAASSWMLVNLGPRILAEDFAAGFSIRLQVKDLQLASELIDELGGEFPGARLTRSLFSKVLNQGYGALGNQGLIKAWKDRNQDDRASKAERATDDPRS